MLFISDLNSIITTQIANLVPKSKVSDKDFVTFCSIFNYKGELYLKKVTLLYYIGYKFIKRGDR